MRTGLAVGFTAALVGACLSTPQLGPISDDTLGTYPDEPRDPAPGSDGSLQDAAVGEDADASADDGAVAPEAGKPDAPVDPTCPPCVGLACAHCSDCVAAACPAGTICCAISPGKSGKYKGMACRATALAGLCPP
jgi:hypothetical protein